MKNRGNVEVAIMLRLVPYPRIMIIIIITHCVFLISEEIVRKINLILEGLSDGAKLEWSEQARGRKGTKSLNS